MNVLLEGIKERIAADSLVEASSADVMSQHAKAVTSMLAWGKKLRKSKDLHTPKRRAAVGKYIKGLEQALDGLADLEVLDMF
jgi:hypothetical protein